MHAASRVLDHLCDNPASSEGREKRQHIAASVRLCVRKAGRWRVPPNWTSGEWMKEMMALGLAAGHEAACQFDPSRGAAAPAFFSTRIMGRLLTRYRQEWSFATRVTNWSQEPEQATLASREPFTSGYYPNHTTDTGLIDAVNQLDETERWLMVQIFWRDRDQSDVARELGVSQPAVSRRYRNVVRKLRNRLLEDSGETALRKPSKVIFPGRW